MVVKIHGVAFSTCTQRVSTVLKELNIPYEILPVNFAVGEHKSEEYLESKQPFGQIPVLEDEDGFKLFESRAIARYLVEKYGKGSSLIPQGLKEKAIFEQAASIEAFDFDPYASGVAYEKVFKPLRGLEGDDAKADQLLSTLEGKLDGYERILKKQKYLAGNEVTLADLFHLPYGWLLTVKVGSDALLKRPNVKRWWEDISTRESWKAVQAELAVKN